MPWFKVDDGFHSHPKTLTAGTAAIGLWTRCGSWSSQHLTDGFVPENVALLYGTRAMVRSLVGAGLWTEADGGYQFHDWGDKNPLREAVEAQREVKRSAGREGGKASGRSRAKDKQPVSTDEAACFDSGSELLNTRTRPVPIPNPGASSEAPSRPRKRATKPPENFEITDDLKAWAAANAPDVRLVVETARMLDWARSKGESRADWPATWRNWMGRAQDNSSGRPSSNRPQVYRNPSDQSVYDEPLEAS